MQLNYLVLLKSGSDTLYCTLCLGGGAAQWFFDFKYIIVPENETS